MRQHGRSATPERGAVARAPVIQTGARKTLTIASCSGRKSHRGVELPEAPFAIARPTVSSGQPWRACHTRYGAHIAAATPAPAHSHRERKMWRGPAIAIPPASPASRKAVRSLSSRPAPEKRPAASHSRWSPPWKTFTATNKIKTQTSKVEGRRTEQVPGADHDHRDRDRRRPEQLGCATTTELTSERCCQRRDRSDRDCRRQTQHGDRPRVEVSHQSSKQRYERRLVGITPRNMPSRFEKVQLVAVVAVTVCKRGQNGKQHSPDRQ